MVLTFTVSQDCVRARKHPLLWFHTGTCLDRAPFIRQNYLPNVMVAHFRDRLCNGYAWLIGPKLIVCMIKWLIILPQLRFRWCSDWNLVNHCGVLKLATVAKLCALQRLISHPKLKYRIQSFILQYFMLKRSINFVLAYEYCLPDGWKCYFWRHLEFLFQMSTLCFSYRNVHK